MESVSRDPTSMAGALSFTAGLAWIMDGPEVAGVRAPDSQSGDMVGYRSGYCDGAQTMRNAVIAAAQRIAREVTDTYNPPAGGES